MTRRASCALLTLLFCVASPLAGAQPKPTLVVLIVVDQMRRDYVDDYGSHWKSGLRRIFDEGAWFTEAAYPYLTTLTCAGHATIGTGTLPSTHGMINNQWWNRDTQQLMTCNHDPSVTELPYGDRPAGGGGSARLLNVPTFASALAEAGHGQGRVVTMSLKRAAATMLAGQRGDAVLWLQGGGFSSSTAYGPTPEKSLLRYLNDHPIVEDFGKSWSRAGKASDYKYDDAGLAEKPSPEWDTTMPHLLQPRSGKPTTFFYQAWEASPYSDAYLGRLASAAIDGLKLGRGPATDFLGVSFSALDVAGHDFGPRSHELQDILLRLDETIGHLLEDLDKKVGRDRYVLAFTADHGVAEIPEQARAEGKDAGRVNMGGIQTLVEAIVSRKFGEGRWVAVQAYSEFYFRAGVFDRIAADPALLAEVVHGIEAVPGVQKVIDGRTLTGPPNPAAPDDPATAAARNSYSAGRSGDLIVVQKPNWIFVSDDKALIPGNATTHGSYYDYDTRVPLVLLGSGIPKGRFQTAVSPADIAPTLAHITGIALPTATGHVLEEAVGHP
jgi:arylsulfatase A-like enzyme